MLGVMYNPIAGVATAGTGMPMARNWDDGRIPGTQIRFDPSLIDALKAEHQEIFYACERLVIACERERVAQIADRLKSLEEQIRQHRMQEDVKLLIFVERRYNDNDQMAMLLTMFRKERDTFKKQISEFFAKYAMIKDCPGMVAELRQEVGTAMGQIICMIEAEEQNFFPLYSLAVDVGSSERRNGLLS